MAIPREGSRNTGDGILISNLPDWCRSPQSPVAYTIYARQNDHEANTATRVRQTGLRSHTKGSLITTCHGDAPGTGLGVRSSTVESICEPRTFSKTVRFESKNAVRHDDTWWMNNKNTTGKLAYVKNVESYDTTPQSKQDWEVKAGQQYAQLAPLLRFGPRFGPLERFGPLGEMAKPFEEVPAEEMPIEPFRPTAPTEVPPPANDNIAPPPPTSHGNQPRPIQPPAPLGSPQPAPQTERTEDNNRTSGCKGLIICFKEGSQLASSLGGYLNRSDFETEYRRQLQMQQDKLNDKTAQNCYADKDRYDRQTGQQKDAQRRRARTFQDQHRTRYIQTYGANSLSGYGSGAAALHRLDMVAGGNEADIADMGNAPINSSIGPLWNLDGRGEELKRYCQEMANRNCPVRILLLYGNCGRAWV
jgi:hypothetical protein